MLQTMMPRIETGEKCAKEEHWPHTKDTQDWNRILKFAPLTNPIPTMAIDIRRRIMMHHRIRGPARHLGGKLEVGTSGA